MAEYGFGSFIYQDIKPRLTAQNWPLSSQNPSQFALNRYKKNGETKKVTFEATIPFAELNMNENPENRPEKNWHNFLTFKIKGDSSVALKVLNGEFSPRFE